MGFCSSPSIVSVGTLLHSFQMGRGGANGKKRERKRWKIETFKGKRLPPTVKEGQNDIGGAAAVTKPFSVFIHLVFAAYIYSIENIDSNTHTHTQKSLK